MKIRVVFTVVAAAVVIGCGIDNIMMHDNRLVVQPEAATVAVGQSVTFQVLEGTIHDWSLSEDIGNHPTQGALGDLANGAADIRISADGRELVLTAKGTPTGRYPYAVWLGTVYRLTSVDSVGQWIRVTMVEP